MFQTFCYVSVGLFTVGLLFFWLYMELRGQEWLSYAPHNIAGYSIGLKFFDVHVTD